ncbi:MAG: aspartate--tRNA ligase [Bacilli bacterium]|nr:aspartate--tRNA ligase [Bacilli bacterium]
MRRTHYNGEIRKSNVGEEVELVGWVSNTRKLGAIQFIDLRDNTGIIQLAIDDSSKVPDVRNEYVISVKGKIRAKEVPNPKLATGEVEVEVKELKVINKAETTPFIIADKTDALEDTRLNYRYLDIRRPVILDNLRKRAAIVKCCHEYFDERRFLEVETPYMNLSSPEGAKEYLVPSRVHPGCFYALDQSPQIFKQLLMIGGVERYYQIARCFRDEDLRSDRQPEFTQIDVEMSFMDQDQILEIGEGLYKKIWKDVLGIDIKTPFRRIDYWDAMDIYGSDKPDTRFDMKIVDLLDILEGTEFHGFDGAKFIKGIVIPSYASSLSRKRMDELQLEAKKFNLKGYMSLKMGENGLEGSFLKFLNEEKIQSLIERTNIKSGDALIFASSSSRRDIDLGLGALRTMFAKELNLIKPGTYDFLWVVNFPMFTRVDEEGKEYVAEHHPFTRPRDEDLKYLDSDPEKVLAYAYDIVINGYEAGGGTLRIYDHDTQAKIFKILGLSDEDVRRKFGWFIDAFKYGCPPHGGFGLGLDRLAMIICGTDNIRDVEAFPKNLQAVDPMSKAPNKVSQEQLDILHIQIKED